MNNLWDQTRLQNYIDNQIEENLTLDYKGAGSLAKQDEKRKEIAKDVSAFANSAGGIIIYGIKEYKSEDKKHLPEKIDPILRTQYSREWLEEIINSNIYPRIEGIIVYPVPLNSDSTQVAYVVEIPKSITAHQASDHKYYKRYNFQSVSMNDYEIQDVRNRRRTITPLVKFGVDVGNNPAIYLVISNPGNTIAQDVKFNFLTPLVWDDNRQMPPLLGEGAKFLSPGDIHKFYYQTFHATLNQEIPSNIDVEVSYFHPEVGQRINETFHIDFRNYQQSLVNKSEMKQLDRTIEKSIKSLVDEIKNVNKRLDAISEIASLTGLQLSIPTLKNLYHLSNHSDELEKIDPRGRGIRFFMEVLDVDEIMASRLSTFYWQGSSG